MYLCYGIKIPRTINTTFHFSSAQEITPTILDIIKHAYHEKPISIYVREDEPAVPDWQMQEVRRRDAATKNDPACLLHCDTVIDELAKELETIGA